MGGHRLEDERQVLNQAASWKELLGRVQQGTFELNRKTFCDLHALVAREEAVEWGVFRTGSVTIAGTDYQPPRWESLESIFEEGLEILRRTDGPHERAIAMFLFGSLNQFFYDGNRRTSRLMMNGILLSAGEDAISVPARRRLEFNEAMIRFYDSRDGTEMMRFTAGCSLDSGLRVDF
ncbi:MAG: Fic family protein [Gammaproteobacteria bacterium]|nr:Fic family protein [Gammaproteobacteria bacterium]MYF30904.1 Fic family protein [Gammaproteobacteria bacterium]MYK45892.1 Fic family protein [Gammaproteobacteria bacterium]